MNESFTIRAEHIFLDALELPPQDAQLYIEEQCGNDQALCKEVQALLVDGKDAASFFDNLSENLGFTYLANALGSTVSTEDFSQMDGQTGQRFGAYSLIEPLGEGGMGTVWLAKRNDGQFEGNVAIKLLHFKATLLIAERFRLEGQYLAKLSHPCIANLMDVGIEDDQPYLAMEYIQGVPVDTFCDNLKYSIDQRIKLYFDLLSAVGHAHSHLIVHRDIKPANVLVSKDATLKLIDFGVAKLLDKDVATSDFTRVWGSALTPNYAAPEQINSDQVSTATDIYSLGVLLFVLLSGCHPRSMNNIHSLAQLCEKANSKPIRLSAIGTDAEHMDPAVFEVVANNRGLSVKEFQKLLRSDLDQILGKALAVDVNERYSSVNDLRSDLQCFLEQKPISAKPHTLAYTSKKLIQRNRGTVLAVSLFSLVLIGASIVSTVQSINFKRQRDIAIYQQQRVQATDEFIRLLFEHIGPNGKALTIQELMDYGTAMLDQQYAKNPPFLGRMFYNIAKNYERLGQRKKSTQMLARAEDIAREQQDEDLLVNVICNRARMSFFNTKDNAISLYQNAAKRMSQMDMVSVDTMSECARTKALYHETNQDMDAAKSTFKTALDYLDKNSFNSLYLRLELLKALSHLNLKEGNYTATLAMNAEIRQQMVLTGRSRTIDYFTLSINRAIVLRIVGEYRQALSLLESIDIAEEASSKQLSYYQRTYGYLLMHLGQYKKAHKLISKTLHEAIKQEDIFEQVTTNYILGHISIEMGELDKATYYLDQAKLLIAHSPMLYRREHQSITYLEALILLMQKHVDKANEQIVKALQKAKYPQEKKGSLLREALKIAARIALAAGDGQRALNYSTDLHQIVESQARVASHSAHVGEALLLRAKAHQMLFNKENAIKDLLVAQTALINGLGEQHTKTIAATSLLNSLNQQ